MAAETQPRFICGQPTHSAAWEGMKSGQRPPHGTPAQSSQRGGPRVSRPAGGEHVRSGRHGRNSLVRGSEPTPSLPSCLTLGTTPKVSEPPFTHL